MKTIKFGRFTFVGVFFAIIGALILLQIFRIQTNAATQKIMVDSENTFSTIKKTIESKRGSVSDKWGNLLAGNKIIYEVGADIPKMISAEGIASALATITGADYGDVTNRLKYAKDNSLMYIPLVNFVDPARVEDLKKVQDTFANEGSNTLRGLVWRPHLQRTYPENMLASNVLGFYSFLDTEGGRGFFGVEGKYDSNLTGSKQIYPISQDPIQMQQMPKNTDGANLVLTLDRQIQAAMERLADKAMVSSGARSATILVYDPRNGEILAMATTPHFNPNEYWTFGKVFPNPEPYNRAIGQTYEPGSVFKVLTMAAAIDAGAVTPETPFFDKGVIEIGGIYIYNWDRNAWGQQNMTTCLQHSLNVCLTWVAKELGPTRFYDYLKAFGIGQRTNVDLSGEVVWPLTLPGDSNWYAVNLGTNSFGQGVAVTPIQMVMAVGALANDGKMMAPHILKAMVQDGRQYNTTPQVVRAPISAASAHTITEMLSVSLEKEASVALVPGYKVAGKTGTGEIPGPKGYLTGVTNASFVGWGPVDDPRFLIYVWLEKPTTSIWGSVVAAPVFSEAFQTIATITNLPPDEARKQLYGK
jgi:cell division protein FtsI/penicillin-binding protein 2